MITYFTGKEFNHPHTFWACQNKPFPCWVSWPNAATSDAWIRSAELLWDPSPEFTRLLLQHGRLE